MLFAWKVCKHVKSNAIVYATKDRTVGVGAGQMSRVDSAKIAVMKALHPTKGPSSPPTPSSRSGTALTWPPGRGHGGDPAGRVGPRRGSDRRGRRARMAMVFTGVRHFRH